MTANMPGDVDLEKVPVQRPIFVGRILSSWLGLACAGSVAAVVLVSGTLFVLKRSQSSASTVQKEAMCYVLQMRGKWFRQDTNKEVKPGQELFADEVLRPERADGDHGLTVYLYGQGAHDVKGDAGPYVVPASKMNDLNAIDRLVALLPRVNRMFPEATIARGDSDESAGSLLLLTEHGLDITPLHVESNGYGKRPFWIRLLPVSLTSPASNDSAQKVERSSEPTRASFARDLPGAAALEFPHTLKPGGSQLLSPVLGLQPGLFRLQIWSGPGRKSPAPVDDSGGFPDRELLVIIFTSQRDFESARAEFDSFQKGAKTNWNRNLSAEMNSELQKAFLLNLAERYPPSQELVRPLGVP
jgi:hypothetical protein